MGKRRNYKDGEWSFRPYSPVPPKKPAGAARADPTAWQELREIEAARLAEEEARIAADAAKLGLKAEEIGFEKELDALLAICRLDELDLGKFGLSDAEFRELGLFNAEDEKALAKLLAD